MADAVIGVIIGCLLVHADDPLAEDFLQTVTSSRIVNQHLHQPAENKKH
jgi:hypothetical protein